MWGFLPPANVVAGQVRSEGHAVLSEEHFPQREEGLAVLWEHRRNRVDVEPIHWLPWPD